MTLLLVNYEYPPVGGGAATATEAIARNLSGLGHDVTVLTSHYGKLPSYFIDDGIALYRISSFRRRADRANLFEMFAFVLTALSRLPGIVRKQQPDGLIVFFSVPSGPIGLAAKWLFGLPYVVSLRGGDVPGLVPELAFAHKVLAPLRRLILRNARIVVANSEGLRKLSEAADPYSVCVIPNGVDTEHFRPSLAGSTLSSEKKPLRALFVGRFQKQKNLDLLLRQFARLPEGSFELCLVGDGPERERLEKLAVELQVVAAIKWCGWLSRSQLADVYQSADFLVNPSSYEGMPNVVLEAMACGLPVVASRVAGIDELVVSGETGRLFDLEKPEDLLRAMKEMSDVDLRRQMGANGRKHVVARFSWRKTTEAYIALFS